MSNKRKLDRLKYILSESKVRANGNWFWTLYIAVKEQILCQFGTSSFDYFMYDLYKLGYLGRREFVNQRKAEHIRKKCNDPKFCTILQDKCLFNERFHGYLHRSWLDMSSAARDVFEEFVNEHKTFIVKPRGGQGGKGIYSCTVDDGTDLDVLYGQLREENAFIEEKIEQCSEFENFNPASINTIRVVTVLTKSGEVKLLSASFRMGTTESCTDNFHTGGIAAEIDIETGLVVTHAVDRSRRGYYIHPKTHRQIIGYKIPMWDQIVLTAARAAKEIPEVRYIGWDLTINSKNEIVIIEGNDNASRDIQQMSSMRGNWYKYRDII